MPGISGRPNAGRLGFAGAGVLSGRAGRGETFLFGVSKRRANVPDELLLSTRAWLLGALTQAEAGAKTTSGYGNFRLEAADGSLQAAADADWSAAVGSAARADATYAVELVPAFLAGANQKADDSGLHPATLGGSLRWWWRTLHAGFVDAETLPAVEGAIWGDTHAGGAVRVTSTVIGRLAEQFNYKDGLK